MDTSSGNRSFPRHQIDCRIVHRWMNSLRRVFSTGSSINHLIVRLDPWVMLAVRFQNFDTAIAVNDMTNVLMIDDYDLAEACSIVIEFGSERFGYVVTPNV